MAENNPYGLRQDGSPKDVGFLGELKGPDDSVSTEVSIGVELDGQEMEIPSLVPGLSQEEINAVLGGDMPDSVVDKAVAHAKQRKEKGLSPFFSSSSSEKESKQPPPWERMLGNAPPVAPTEEIVEPKKQMPWEMMLGNERIQENIQPAETPSGSVEPTNFENIFENLIKAESKGKHRNKSGKLLTSSAGAQGVTQVMPKTGKDPGYGVQPIQNDSEEEFRRFGRDYLQAMLKEFDGDYSKAVAAYNAGPGNVKKAITKGGENWTQFLPKKSETIPYMNKILGGNFG